jgi:cytochrome c-type biogenesis protein CcmH
MNLSEARMANARNAALAFLLLCGSMLCAAEGAIEAFAFDNPSQEARYRSLSEEFRCPKCLNTNLAGSDAPIAADLRDTVHRLILEGATDQAIRDYLQARYGDFVLYNPPVRRGTLLLWLAPAVLLAIGAFAIVVMVLRRRGVDEPLNDAEQARLAELLRDAAVTAKDAQ